MNFSILSYSLLLKSFVSLPNRVTCVHFARKEFRLYQQEKRWRARAHSSAVSWCSHSCVITIREAWRGFESRSTGIKKLSSGMRRGKDQDEHRNEDENWQRNESSRIAAQFSAVRRWGPAAIILKAWYIAWHNYG